MCQHLTTILCVTSAKGQKGSRLLVKQCVCAFGISGDNRTLLMGMSRRTLGIVCSKSPSREMFTEHMQD